MQQLVAGGALRVHVVPTVDLASSQREIGGRGTALGVRSSAGRTGAGQARDRAARRGSGEAVEEGRGRRGDKSALCRGESKDGLVLPDNI